MVSSIIPGVTTIRQAPGYYAVYQLNAIPGELRDLEQFVLWKYEPATPKPKKVPVDPRTYRNANVTNPATWASFKDSVLSYARNIREYNGIGLVLTQDDTYSFLDFDGCLTGRTIDPGVAQVLRRFPGAYVEVSPSGRGLKVLLKGKLPGPSRHKEGVECYDCLRYTTLTGQALQVVKELPDHSTELTAWYQEVFPIPTTAPTTSRVREQDSPPLKDWEVRRLVGRSEKYKRLLSGDFDDYPSQSEADLALCVKLAFYTQDAEQIDRIFRESGLYREKWDAQHGDMTYGERTIQKALDSLTDCYQPRTDRREYIEIVRTGLPIEQVRPLVSQDIDQALNSDTATVIAAPPGTGKSHIAAELGKEHNIAWIAERHDMVDQVESLLQYRHIHPCTQENCPEYKQHEQLSRLGYSTWAMHKQHGCEYIAQFDQRGSAIYMRQHAATAYPTQHKGVIVDEFDPMAWVNTLEIDHATIQDTRNLPYTGERLKQFLRALLLVADGDGKQFFDSLAQELAPMKLRDVLMELADDPMVMVERPTPRVSLDIAPRVFLPTLVKEMLAELDQWETGKQFNSAIHVVQGKIVVLTPRRLHTGTAELPLIVLDATAHESIMHRLLGREVLVKRYDVALPTDTRHIAVRVGKGYSMGQLLRVSNHRQQMARLIKEARYVLGGSDMSNVGLITYKGLENPLGDALGIPEQHRGHFYGVRGSNAYEGLDTLIVVGTPLPNIGEVLHMARMLYRDDPEYIPDYQAGKIQQNNHRLTDLLAYLARAELTQAAHRNRPLVYGGRKVVSFCDTEIDYLPATEVIKSIPNL